MNRPVPHRRFPLRAFASWYAAYLLIALGLGLGPGAWVRSAWGAFPGGDRALFEQGGLYFSELLRLSSSTLAVLAQNVSFVGLAAAYLGLIPLAAMMHAVRPASSEEPVSHPTSSAPSNLAAGVSALGTFSLLLGATLALQAAGIFLFATIATLLGTKLNSAFDDRTADLLRLAIVTPAVAWFFGLRIAQDLARAVSLQRADLSTVLAAARAVGFMQASFGPVVSWLWRAGVGVAVLIVAAIATDRMGTTTTFRFLTVVVLHQLAFVALLALRTSWLAWVMSHVSHIHDGARGRRAAAD